MIMGSSLPFYAEAAVKHIPSKQSRLFCLASFPQLSRPVQRNELIFACMMQGTPEGVEDSGWLTRVAAFPIGIQPEKFVEALDSQDVKGSISGLLARYAGRKVQPFANAMSTRLE